MALTALFAYIEDIFNSLPEEDKADLGKLDVNGVPFTKVDIIYAAAGRDKAKRELIEQRTNNA